MTPGSSRKTGGGRVETGPDACLEWVEVLRRFRFLAAIVLNLSRQRTLVKVSWARVLWPSSI
ncbi:MAG: hypothetical protein G01um101416_1166 [Microgenomates group bacterium Gr01-1014_16]|nr:MAG: hypothetical protein G01um101416_1166 [Microgenomates group bacterium Gr01-1014_16]